MARDLALEVALGQHPGVADALVNARQTATGVEIIAYVRPSEASLSGVKAMNFSVFYFSDSDDGNHEDDYGLYIEASKLADRLGFSAVWTPERHFTSVGAASPNPSVLSAALAMVTERISLRSGSVVLPLHSAIRVAEEWAVVDRLSNGRVELSFASGWVPDDFVFAPDNYNKRHEVMLSMIEDVAALWRGERVRARNGVGNVSEIAIRPRPVQPELPIWLTAASSRRTFEAAGRLGMNVLTAMLQLSAEQLRENISAYRDARRNAGHGPGFVAVMLHTYVQEDAATAVDEARPHLRSYFRSQTNLRQNVARSLGRQLDGTDKYMEKLIDHAVERYIAEKALVGSPESCQALLEGLRSSGVDEIACLIDFGINSEKVLSSLKVIDGLRRGQLDKPGSGALLDFLRTKHPDLSPPTSIVFVDQLPASEAEQP